MFLVSMLAYLALVGLLAGGRGLFRPGRPGRWLGLVGPGAAFLFLPNDSLPPFLDFAWSGPAFWLALLLGALSQAGRGRRSEPAEAQTSATPIQVLIFSVAWLGLCFYAFRRGLAGDLPGLCVFAATALLAQAGPAGVPGLFALFLALAPRAARREEDSPGPALTRLALSAFLVTVFFPFSLSALLKTSAPPALALDFGLFWGKVLLLNRLLAPRLAKLGRGATLLLGAAGIALMAVDIF